LFLLRVFDIRGDIQAFLVEKRFDLFQSKPVLLAFLSIAIIPIKPENLYMSHMFSRVDICLYKCQGTVAKVVSFCQRHFGLDHGVGTPAASCRGQTPKPQINMAFEDFGRHPQWPKVADAVIEADTFNGIALRKRGFAHQNTLRRCLWCCNVHKPVA
jgi:hypothetical protein